MHYAKWKVNLTAGHEQDKSGTLVLIFGHVIKKGTAGHGRTAGHDLCGGIN